MHDAFPSRVVNKFDAAGQHSLETCRLPAATEDWPPSPNGKIRERWLVLLDIHTQLLHTGAHTSKQPAFKRRT